MLARMPPSVAAVLLLVAHAGEQPAVADADLDLAADLAGERDRGIVVVHAFVEPLQVERDLRCPSRRSRARCRSARRRCRSSRLRRPRPRRDRAGLVGRIERAERCFGISVMRHRPLLLRSRADLSETGLRSRQNRRSRVRPARTARPASQPISTDSADREQAVEEATIPRAKLGDEALEAELAHLDLGDRRGDHPAARDGEGLGGVACRSATFDGSAMRAW